MQKTEKRPASGQWGMFLRNHDELDLGRLSKTQRQQVFDAFGPNPEDQLYDRGIRRRLAPMLGGDRRRIELAYSLMFTLPGTPVLRYGDELGMGDDLSLPERVCCRTPMQWSTEPNGGFTKSDKPVVPVISDGPYGFQHVNAAEQRRDPDSMLNWTERIIRMRKEVPEIGWGEFKVLDAGDNAVLALRYDWRNNSVLFLHNFAGEPREVAFSTGLKGERQRHADQPADARSQPGRQERQARASVSSLMAIAGTGSAGWIICSSAANSERGRSGIHPKDDAFIAAQSRIGEGSFDIHMRRQQNGGFGCDRSRQCAAFAGEIQRDDEPLSFIAALE